MTHRPRSRDTDDEPWRVVSEFLPHALDHRVPLAVFEDADDAETYLRLAAHRRPWWGRQLRTHPRKPFVDTPRALEEHARILEARSTPPRMPTQAQRELSKAWRSDPWRCSYRSAWVVIDALFDELVWSFEEHPKGGHPFSIDQPIADYLAGNDPVLETPDDLPAFESARPRITEALAAHRRADIDRCPASAAYRGDLPQLRSLLDGGASLEQRDPAHRTPLAAALSGGQDGVLGRSGSRAEAPQERVVLELMARGASVPAALEVVEPDRSCAIAGEAPASLRDVPGRAPRQAISPNALLLDIAMRRRWYVLAEHLLARGVPANEAVPVRPIELLFLMGGPPAFLERLLERGAHIEATSPIWTPGLLARLERSHPALHRFAEGVIQRGPQSPTNK